MDKKLFLTGYIAGILLTVAIGYYGYRKLTYSPDVELEKIEITDLSGVSLNLAAQHQKPMVVNFWATWCGPCRQEFPNFSQAHKKYGDKVSFVMISDEELDKIATFKTTSMLPFFFVRSVKPLSDYDISSIPVTYFFDASGELVSKHSGTMELAEIEKEIQKCL